jgi:hypothetical protein
MFGFRVHSRGVPETFARIPLCRRRSRQTFCTISGAPQFMRDVRVPFRSSSGDGVFLARHGCSVLRVARELWKASYT